MALSALTADSTTDVVADTAVDAIQSAVRAGLAQTSKTLPPWLFYDDAGSALFERITELPEYYLTRTERALLEREAESTLDACDGPVTVTELGAGSGAKTGILLRAAARRQGSVLYQPVDVSTSALEQAQRTLTAAIPDLTVHPTAANYTTEPIAVERRAGHAVLALYIGSSIGNFQPQEQLAILAGLRASLKPGDRLLLGVDLAPGPDKTEETLVAAYDDADGVTACFNRNVLTRLNRDLGTDFAVECFAHHALWNEAESRIEMHLRSLTPQTVRLPAWGGEPELALHFAQGETIHTENSYKFTVGSIEGLLTRAGFFLRRQVIDAQGRFAVTLAVI